MRASRHNSVHSHYTSYTPQAIALEHGNRLKTLLSVDDLVEGLVHSMPADEWANTFFLYCTPPFDAVLYA